MGPTGFDSERGG